MKKPWRSGSIAGGNARPGGGHPSIRGRISGPYPIPTPMDDEFPMRNPGTGIATPVGAEFKDSETEAVLPSVEQHQQHRPAPAPPGPPDISSPRPDVAQALQENSTTRPLGSAPTARHPPLSYRMNGSNANRYSVVSAGTAQSRGSKDRPQRKKSTLRGAFGKLFNRRRKMSVADSSYHDDSEEGPPLATLHQRSATVKENRILDMGLVDRPRPATRTRPFPGAESKRSASLPITEFDRALRSHSIGPEDVLAIESARNSLSADFGLARKRFAAFRERESGLAGLSPRPASTQGREGRTTQANENPDDIGRAITSDFTRVRRRSRSLSGLIEVDDDPSTTRRRSDEIRYWRESYDPAFMSPVSSHGPEGEGEHTGRVSPETIESVEEKTPEKRPEPFTFGSFGPMGRMPNMKITEAASFEARIGDLEARVNRLEQVLTRLCDTVPDFQLSIDSMDAATPRILRARPSTSYTPKAATQHPPMRQTITESAGNSSRPKSSPRSVVSHMSFGEAPTYVDSVHRSTAQLRPNASNRPTSMATVRGTSSLPNFSRENSGPFTIDHYTTLMALIHTERSAREALEAQVKRLGYQVTVLEKPSTSAHHSIGFNPPPTAKSFGDYSAFDHDDEGDNASIGITSNSRGRSAPHEDSGIEPTQGDGSEYSELYETPREEGYTYGAFGEQLDESDKLGEQTTRTLSLSQLTLGKRPQAL